MLHFVDTNVLVALILESDEWHSYSSNFFNREDIGVGIPESTYREFRRTFATKYNGAMTTLLKAVGKARKENINSVQEFTKRVEDLTFEIGMKHNPALKNFLEYLIAFSKYNKLLEPSKCILLARELDNHLLTLLSKIRQTGKNVEILNVNDNDLELSCSIHKHVGGLFKDVGDLEIFCEVISILYRKKEKGVFYTLDKEFIKSGHKALDRLKKNNYDVNLELVYLPDIISISQDNLIQCHKSSSGA